MTDRAELHRAASAVWAAFPDPWIRQYSVKANDVPAIVAEVTSRGFGANVVSRGEWAVARRAGVPADPISQEGVGNTDADLRAAIRSTAAGAKPRLWVAQESADQGGVLNPKARRARQGRREPLAEPSTAPPAGGSWGRASGCRPHVRYPGGAS